MNVLSLRSAALFCLGLATTATLHGQSRTYVITKGGNNVAEFHAEDTYDTFDGKTSDVSGTIVADAANPSAASVLIVPFFAGMPLEAKERAVSEFTDVVYALEVLATELGITPDELVRSLAEKKVIATNRPS